MAASSFLNQVDTSWQTVAEGSLFHSFASSVSAELIACSQAVDALMQMHLNGRVEFDADGRVLNSIAPQYQNL
jgi:hypothetical protein